MKKTFDFLLYGNVFIALCAVCFTLETYLLAGEEMRFDGLLIFVFFITLFVYNGHRLLTSILLSTSGKSQKAAGVYNTKKYQITISSISVLGMGASFFYVSESIYWVMGLLGVIVFLYGIIIIAGKGRFHSIRIIGMLKIFFIALIWSMATVLIPLLNESVSISFSTISLLLVERYLFIFTIALVFDVRDLDYDKAQGIKTVPNVLGQRNTKRLTYLLLAVFWLLFGFHDDSASPFFLPLFLSVAITGVSIYFITKKSSDLTYMTVVNGMMVLQFYLVWLFR